MIIPRCKKCGKVSIHELCYKCKSKRLYKPEFVVICSICGLRSYTTAEKWVNKPYKCKKCR